MKVAKVFDFNNYLYRVFHTSSPTYTVEGLRNDVIKRVYKELASERDNMHYNNEVFIVTDANSPTFRHKLTDTYKSESKGMPEELKAQEGPLLHLLKSGGFKVLTKEGYEADDTMGMLANYLLEHGFTHIYIVSNDKDLLQLVTDQVSIQNPSSKKLLSYDSVIEKLGVPPKAVPDLLAITGDSADGIIGIDGVGLKTAARWINEFGSAANLLKNKESVKGRGAKALIQSTVDIELNMKLTTIASDSSLLSDEEISIINSYYESDDFDKLLGKYEVYTPSRSNTPIELISKEKTPEPDMVNKNTEQLSFF